MPDFVTKPGKHGTLYRYVLEYTDPSDPGWGRQEWKTWAYNLEHAEDRFYEGEDSAGYKILQLRREHEGLDQHRAVRHAPMSLPPGTSRG